jgi:hypothetical protein
MSQREIQVTPSRFGWLLLAFIFAGTAGVHVYLLLSTAARWPGWAAMVLGVLALTCVTNSGLGSDLARARADIRTAESGEPVG